MPMMTNATSEKMERRDMARSPVISLITLRSAKPFLPGAIFASDAILRPCQSDGDSSAREANVPQRARWEGISKTLRELSLRCQTRFASVSPHRHGDYTAFVSAPSMMRLVPEIRLAIGLATKTTPAATSWGVPMRPVGFNDIAVL